MCMGDLLSPSDYAFRRVVGLQPCSLLLARPRLLCRMSPSCFSANFFDVRAVELVLCALLAALLYHLTNTILAKHAYQKIETLGRLGVDMARVRADVSHCSRAGTSASRRLSWNFGHRVKFFSIHWFVS